MSNTQPSRGLWKALCLVGAFSPMAVQAQAVPPPPPADSEAIQDLESQIKELRNQIGNIQPGNNKFLLTGYTVAGYEARQGENRTFTANFNPIFLWKISDKLFFQAESEMEFDQMSGSTNLNLEYANIVYFVNDYMSVSAGKFLTPFSSFTERYHAGWINRSVTKPMYASEEGGLVPYSGLGVQVRGAIPMGDARLRYAFWVDNGPFLGLSAEQAGSLQFEGGQASDRNNSLKAGGHLWFLPIPNLEIGYARYQGRPAARGTGYDSTTFTLQEVDLTYRRESQAINGVLEIRGEWISSEISPLDAYTDAGGNPIAPFENKRTAGLGQVSYRPSAIEGEILRNVETVVRYDWVKRPAGDPTGLFNQKRMTYNLNYWFGPGAVLKAGFEKVKNDDPGLGGATKSGFLASFALQF